MKQTQPDDIRIPRTLWLSQGLSLREKALLAEIGKTDPTRGYSGANHEIAAFLGVAERRVRACIAAVREKGFVTVLIDSRKERIIRPTAKLMKLIQLRRDRSIPVKQP